METNLVTLTPKVLPPGVFQTSSRPGRRFVLSNPHQRLPLRTYFNPDYWADYEDTLRTGDIVIVVDQANTMELLLKKAYSGFRPFLITGQLHGAPHPDDRNFEPPTLGGENEPTAA